MIKIAPYIRREFAIYLRGDDAHTDQPVDFTTDKGEAKDIAKALNKSFREGDLDCTAYIVEET